MVVLKRSALSNLKSLTSHDDERKNILGFYSIQHHYKVVLWEDPGVGDCTDKTVSPKGPIQTFSWTLSSFW